MIYLGPASDVELPDRLKRSHTHEHEPTVEYIDRPRLAVGAVLRERTAAYMVSDSYEVSPPRIVGNDQRAA